MSLLVVQTPLTFDRAYTPCTLCKQTLGRQHIIIVVPVAMLIVEVIETVVLEC